MYEVEEQTKALRGSGRSPGYLRYSQISNPAAVLYRTASYHISEAEAARLEVLRSRLPQSIQAGEKGCGGQTGRCRAVKEPENSDLTSDYGIISAGLSTTTSDCRNALTCTNLTQPDRRRQNLRAWHAEGQHGVELRSGRPTAGGVTITVEGSDSTRGNPRHAR
jgi:hypothetical protein